MAALDTLILTSGPSYTPISIHGPWSSRQRCVVQCTYQRCSTETSHLLEQVCHMAVTPLFSQDLIHSNSDGPMDLHVGLCDGEGMEHL